MDEQRKGRIFTGYGSSTYTNSDPLPPFARTDYIMFALSNPVYQFVDASKNNVCVYVKTDCGPIAYTYVGGEASKVEESCEKAAQKAVQDLTKKYEVYVEDVTSIKRKMFGRCAAMYRLKLVELDRVDKGLPKITLHEDLSDDVCSATKQSLAKKALFHLISVYNFQVVDANYRPTNSRLDAALCALARERYLSLKERVQGLKEDLEPSLFLVKQDCLTPRGAAFQIPPIASPPLPPKKRKSQPVIASPFVIAASETEVPLHFSSLPELDTVFKRSKFV